MPLRGKTSWSAEVLKGKKRGKNDSSKTLKEVKSKL